MAVRSGRRLKRRRYGLRSDEISEGAQVVAPDGVAIRDCALCICAIVLNNTDLTGEYEDRNFVITRGDSRIAITIGRNEYTSKLKRTNRFLIDDAMSQDVLAYSLTKPLKVGHVYNDSGVFIFVLQEVTTTCYDNIDLRIADYYLHFPEADGAPQYGESDGTTDHDIGEDSYRKERWI